MIVHEFSAQPLEIQQYIIALLDDRKAILDCGRVCKNWLFLSRSMMFSKAIMCNPTTAGRNDLTSLLRHPHSTLPVYLTRVYIVMPRRSEDNTERDYVEVFTALAKHAPSIRDLKINYPLHQPQSLLSVHTHLLVLLRAILPQVRKVEVLPGVDDGRYINSLVKLLSRSPVLTDLVIGQWIGNPSQVGNWTRSLEWSHAPPPSLRTLNTSFLYPAFLESWGLAADIELIMNVDHETDLEALHIFLSHPDLKKKPRWRLELDLRGRNGAQCKRFLDSAFCASHISTLVLVFRCPGPDLEFDLQHCTSLYTFRLKIDISDASGSEPSFGPALSSLTTISAGVIPSLSLEIMLLHHHNAKHLNETYQQFDAMVHGYLQGPISAAHRISLSVRPISSANMIGLSVYQSYGKATRWISQDQFPLCVARSLADRNFRINEECVD